MKRSFWLLFTFLVLTSGCTQTGIHSIYVADFESLSPQPEADLLAQKIPDSIAQELEDKDAAALVSRNKVNDAELIVKGRIVNYVPAQGWQRFQSAHAFLTVVVQAHGKNSRGEPVGYSKQFNFNNALPEKGIFMAFIRSLGVVGAKVITAPFGGMSSEENKIAEKAARDIYTLITTFADYD